MPADKSISKASENRRSNKPIMEKKRRARINNCLNELKNLLLEAMRKDPSRHSKLEKADILEMTVKHLQNLQRRQMALSMAADPLVVTKYRAGFNECAQEVSRYVNTLDGIDSPAKHRLLNHLANCINGLGSVFPGSQVAGAPLVTSTGLTTPSSSNVVFDGTTRRPPPLLMTTTATTAISTPTTTSLGRGPGGVTCLPGGEASLPGACAAVAPPSFTRMPHGLSNGTLTMVLKPNTQVATAPNWHLTTHPMATSMLRPGGVSPVASCAPSPKLETHPEARVGPVWISNMSPDSTTSGRTVIISPAGVRQEKCTRTIVSPSHSPDSQSIIRSESKVFTSDPVAVKERNLLSPSPSSPLSSEYSGCRRSPNSLSTPQTVKFGQCASTAKCGIIQYGHQNYYDDHDDDDCIVEPVNLSKDAADKMWRPW